MRASGVEESCGGAKQILLRASCRRCVSLRYAQTPSSSSRHAFRWRNHARSLHFRLIHQRRYNPCVVNQIQKVSDICSLESVFFATYLCSIRLIYTLANDVYVMTVQYHVFREGSTKHNNIEHVGPLLHFAQRYVFERCSRPGSNLGCRRRRTLVALIHTRSFSYNFLRCIAGQLSHPRSTHRGPNHRRKIRKGRVCSQMDVRK